MRGLTIAVCGDSGSGKSSFLQRTETDCFLDTHSPHLSDPVKRIVDFERREHPIQLFEKSTAIDERFDNGQVYKSSDAILILIDLSNSASLDTVEKRIQLCQRDKKDSTPIMLVGTKADLPRQITEEALLKLANDYKLTSIETSSKTGANIETVVTNILKLKFPAPASTNLMDPELNRLLIQMNKYLQEYGDGKFHTIANLRLREANWTDLLQRVKSLSSITGGHYEIPSCATAVPPGKMSNTYGELHARIIARIAELPPVTVRATLETDPRYQGTVTTAQTPFASAFSLVAGPSGAGCDTSQEL